MIDLQHALTIGTECAQLAGERIVKGYDEDLDIDTKSDPVDRVTHIDIECQNIIYDRIFSAFPDHGFLGEEDLTQEGSGDGQAYRWVIDPLDGTSNFIQRLPHVGVSIALQHEKQSVLGILHFPVLGTTYTAIKDQGAFCNNQPIHVSECSDMKKAFVAEIFTDRGHRGTQVGYPPALAYRKFGSAITSLAYLAHGKIHATALRCCRWDIAAAEIIIAEAGGTIEWEYVDPNDERGTLHCFAGVPGIFEEFVSIAKTQYL